MATTRRAAAVAAALLLLGLGMFVAYRATQPEPVVPENSAPPVAPPRPGARDASPERRVPRQTTAPDTTEPDTPAAAPDSARAKLERTKIAVDWTEDRIDDVLGELADRTGVEIVLCAEAVEHIDGNGPLGRLTLDRAVPARQILDILTALSGLGWIAEERRVVIVVAGIERNTSLPVVALRRSPPGQAITVGGRVTDASGAPVRGAQIFQFHTRKRVATTGADGAFECVIQRPYGSIEARATGLVPSARQGVSGRPGGRTNIDLTVGGPAGAITVKVTCDGVPVPFANVSVTVPQAARPVPASDERALQGGIEETCDEAGNATIDGVAAGPASVAAFAPGFQPAARSVEVKAGQPCAVEIALVRKAPLAERVAKDRVSLSLGSASPASIARALGEIAEINVVIDPDFAATLGSRTISLSAEDRPLAEVLQEFCDEIGGAAFDVKDDVVHIHAAAR